MLSMLIQRALLGWLFYFILHYYKIQAEKLNKIILIVGVIWIILTFLQQYTFPNYWFFTRGEDVEKLETRFGLYRYAIAGEYYVILAFYTAFVKYFSTKSIKSLFLLITFLFGIYLTVTRQIIVSSVFCMFIYPIFISKVRVKTRILILSVISLFVFLVYLNRDYLFGSMIMATNEQLDDNVRYAAYQFFLFEHWDHWITYIFGNGIAHIDSSYGKYIFGKIENQGIIQGDIGIIGILSQYGIFYIFITTALIMNSIKPIFRKIPSDLKLFFINLLMIIPLIFFFRNFSGYIFGSIILYLCDYYYKTSLSNVNHKLSLKQLKYDYTH
ncbi:hypothetical protein [Spirosoma humi]